MTALALPVRRAFADVTVGRGALAFWLCVPLVLGALFLVRDSGVVAVHDVRIVGLDGYYEKPARRALVAEAQTMSTLNVDETGLRDAIGQFVDVAKVETKTDFPHGLTVIVSVRRAVASARLGGKLVGLTAGGLALESTRSIAQLPRIEIEGGFKDDRVLGPVTRRQLAILGGAPDLLLRRVKGIKYGARGIVVTLDRGVQLIFGDTSAAAQKWNAAAAVLADPAAQGAKYIDLRIADRPAIGGLGAAPVTIKPVATTTPTQQAETNLQTPEQVQQRYGAAGGPSTPVETPAATPPATGNGTPVSP